MRVADGASTHVLLIQKSNVRSFANGPAASFAGALCGDRSCLLLHCGHRAGPGNSFTFASKITCKQDTAEHQADTNEQKDGSEDGEGHRRLAAVEDREKQTVFGRTKQGLSPKGGNLWRRNPNDSTVLVRFSVVAYFRARSVFLGSRSFYTVFIHFPSFPMNCVGLWPPECRQLLV